MAKMPPRGARSKQGDDPAPARDTQRAPDSPGLLGGRNVGLLGYVLQGGSPPPASDNDEPPAGMSKSESDAIRRARLGPSWAYRRMLFDDDWSEAVSRATYERDANRQAEALAIALRFGARLRALDPRRRDAIDDVRAHGSAVVSHDAGADAPEQAVTAAVWMVEMLEFLARVVLTPEPGDIATLRAMRDRLPGRRTEDAYGQILDAVESAIRRATPPEGERAAHHPLVSATVTLFGALTHISPTFDSLRYEDVMRLVVKGVRGGHARWSAAAVAAELCLAAGAFDAKAKPSDDDAADTRKRIKQRFLKVQRERAAKRGLPDE